jgi:hypothetical protein
MAPAGKMAFMRRFSTFFLLSSLAACLAQDLPATAAPNAPPEVDQALRDRVMKFFQTLVEGKFRQAEQYVAEDTKDLYYNSPKGSYRSFEITKITYEDSFRKAIVVLQAAREVSTQLGKMTFNTPQEYTWKLEGGLWCWYVEPARDVRTPFGVLKRSQTAGAPGAPPKPAVKPLVSGVDEIWNQVSADKQVVHFPANGGSAEVVVRNALPGSITLKLQAPTIPGLEARLEHDQIASKASGRVLLKYTPQSQKPAPTTLNVVVESTNQTIPIQVVFDPPAK